MDFSICKYEKKNYLLHMNFVCFQLLPSEVIFPVKQWLCRVQMYCRLKPVFSFSRNRNSVHSVQPLKFVLRIMETKAIVLQKVAVLSFFKLFIERNLKKNEIFHTYVISICDVTCIIKIYVFIQIMYILYIYICNSILSFLKNMKLT